MRAIFLDIETNGLNPYIHKPLEIAFKIVDLVSGESCCAYSRSLTLSKEAWQQSDPSSLEINHFSWQTASSATETAVVKEEIIALFDKWDIKRKKAVFICQNPSFDRPFFSQIIPVEIQESKLWPYHWLDLASMFFAVQIKELSSVLPWETGLSKDNIAGFYHLPKEAHPHRAMNGVDHLIECYKAVVGLPSTALKIND